MAVVLRIPAAATDEEALGLLVEAGATEVEVDGPDLLGLFPHGAQALPPELAGARFEPAVLVDWDSVWAAALRPQVLGPLTLVPWDGRGTAPAAGPGRLVLEVGPAFGSARHPSTRLCLRWLLDRPSTGEVLDLGAGNGVLALAALALGAERALAVETEPEALAVAERNALRAGLRDRLELARSLPPERRFHRVVANILASPLIDLAPDLARALGPGGELCVSGFGPSLREDVARALRHAGLRVVGGEVEGDWCRLDAAAPW